MSCMDPEYEKRLLLRQHGTSPLSSPVSPALSPYRSPRKEVYSDRFIPSRAGSNWEVGFNLLQENIDSNKSSPVARETSPDSKECHAYNCLLKNELLGTEIDDLKVCTAIAVNINNMYDVYIAIDDFMSSEEIALEIAAKMQLYTAKNDQDAQGSCINNENRATPKSSCARNLFQFQAKRIKRSEFDGKSYSLSPVSKNSHNLLRSPRKATRKISKVPFKVLDAPELQDDFYLNLVDWSQQNILSVGLGTCVYLWSACTSQVTKLCDLSDDSDSVTSVSWAERTGHVAVGTHRGFVQIWDATAQKKLRTLEGHTARVGAIAWNGELLCSGSRDRSILQRDLRSSEASERKLVGHRQEVCGLKWSPDHQHLASGGNDNKLLVWNTSCSTPVQQYNEHTAAVKAISWSPHQHGLLASGGGTADRCIRFWNTLAAQPLQSVDTGSQVCNLAWSKHSNELVSTHGYSQNQILVWKYPSLTQVAKLTGHSYRVLYLAVSPDGEAIVTGAGDETLRFWNVFSKARSQKECKSELNLFTKIR